MRNIAFLICFGFLCTSFTNLPVSQQSSSPFLKFHTEQIKKINADSNVTNLRIVTRSESTATIKFTKGNGSKRLILIKAGNSLTFNPPTAGNYSASPVFGQGTQPQPGTYVVFKDSGDSVNITNLQHSTTYTIKAFEIDGPDDSNILTDYAPSVTFITSAPRPADNFVQIKLSNVKDTSVTVSIKPGKGEHRLVTLKLQASANVAPKNDSVYNSDTRFGYGDHLGVQNYAVAVDDTIVHISGLSPATTYFLNVFEYNGEKGYATYNLKASTLLFNTVAVEPTKQASNLYVTDITGTEARFHVTPGNGKGRFFLLKKNSPVTFHPIDGAQDNALDSAITFDSEQSSFRVSKLIPNTVYHLAAYEFNGDAWPRMNYRTDSVPAFTFKTQIAAPTIQASRLNLLYLDTASAQITCLPGNGDRRLFVIREGQPVTDVPQNGISYDVDQDFGKGSRLGNKTYVFANTQPAVISGLKKGTRYYIRVFEYYVKDSIIYRTHDAPSMEFITPGTVLAPQMPPVPASGLKITSVTHRSARIDFLLGDGEKRLVVVAPDSISEPLPVDGKEYTFNPVYEEGEEIASGGFAVSGSSGVTISGLDSNTRYAVSVFEYNGTQGSAKYLRDPRPRQTFLTDFHQPTIQAKNIVITNQTGVSATIDCTPGNGESRAVIIALDTVTVSTSLDKMILEANTEFGKGSKVYGNGYVVSMTSTPVTVTGLMPNTRYQVIVMEYNGSGDRVNFLHGTVGSLKFTTPFVEPLTAASRIEVQNIRHDEATVSFIPGSGSGRLVIIQMGDVVTGLPVDGTTYTANPMFGSGSNLGNICYVVADGSEPVTIKGLLPNREYTVSVIEYNGQQQQINYMGSGSPVKTFRTLPLRLINSLEIDGAFVKPYPNPVSGNQLTTSVDTEKAGNFIIEVFSADGNLIIRESAQLSVGRTEIKTDLSKVPSQTMIVVKYSFGRESKTIRLLKL